MDKDEMEEKAQRIEDFLDEKLRGSKLGKTLTLVSYVVTTILVAAVVLAMFLSHKGSEEPVKSEQLTPATVTAEGSFIVKSDSIQDDAQRVDMFFDPICPGCGVVDRALTPRITELVNNGEIILHLTPVAFLDEASTDNYSTRAVNAIVTVAEHDNASVLKFVNALFTKSNQPSPGAGYLPVTDAQLAEIAKSVGVPEKVANTFEQGRYIDWVVAGSEKQKERTDLFPTGFSTPSVFIGVEYSNGIAVGNKVPFQDSDILEIFEEALKQ